MASFTTFLFAGMKEITCTLLLVCISIVGFLLDNIEELLNNPVIISYLGFLEAIAGVLYITGIGFAVAEWAINTNEGHGTNILSTFKYILLGFVVVLGFTSIPILLFKFTAECTRYLVLGTSMDTLLDTLTQNLTNKVVDHLVPGGNLLYPIFILILIFCMFKVFLGNLKRAGVLVVQLTACPFHIFSIPRGYVDAFFSWCKQLVALYLTTFVQNFLVVLSIAILCTAKGVTVTSLCLSTGVALAASEAPRILQQFGLDTSVRANPTQAIYAVQGATNIVTKFIGK